MSIKMFLNSTIGKKYIIATTGLLLSIFILGHMAGNFLIFLGPEAYNQYSHALTSNRLLYVIEFGLALVFVIHMVTAGKLDYLNRLAKPVGQGTCCASSEKGARFGSKSMIYTGLLVLMFTVFHLWTFKFGQYYSVSYHGVEMRDVYRLVMEKFQNPLYSGWYFVALIVLGIHLSHGFSALYQTLGLGSVCHPIIKVTGYLFAAVVTLGFISQPIYALIRGSIL